MKIIKQQTGQSNWYPTQIHFFPHMLKSAAPKREGILQVWCDTNHLGTTSSQAEKPRGMEAGFLLEQPGREHCCWGPYPTRNHPTHFQPRLGAAQGLTAKLSACSDKCKSLFAYILWQKWQPDKSWRIPERHPLEDILHTTSDHRKIELVIPR